MSILYRFQDTVTRLCIMSERALKITLNITSGGIFIYFYLFNPQLDTYANKNIKQ